MILYATNVNIYCFSSVFNRKITQPVPLFSIIANESFVSIYVLSFADSIFLQAIEISLSLVLKDKHSLSGLHWLAAIVDVENNKAATASNFIIINSFFKLHGLYQLIIERV